MLKLYNNDTVEALLAAEVFSFPRANDEYEAILHEAYNVRLSREVNGEFDLTFEHPYSENGKKIAVNKIVTCYEMTFKDIRITQVFRVMKLNRQDANTLTVTCRNVYNADAGMYHLMTFPLIHYICPWFVISSADSKEIEYNCKMLGMYNFDKKEYHVFKDTHFHVYPYDDTMLNETFGLKWLGYNGIRTALTQPDPQNLKIEMEPETKTTPYDIVKRIIAICGKGEIFINGFNLALVEQIGEKRNIDLDLARNMENVEIQYDMSAMTTKLFPYGKDDMNISMVTATGNTFVKTAGDAFIVSPTAEIYGYRENFRDFNDIETAAELYTRACWEFSANNPERIDLPEISIKGNFIDLAMKYGNDYSLNVGDTVTVKDRGETYTMRVIKKVWYPYEAKTATITLGRVKRDLYWYLNTMSAFTKHFAKITNSAGKITGKKITGYIGTDLSDGETTRLQIGTATITAKGGNLFIDGKQIMTS